jgi:hypothetical protein
MLNRSTTVCSQKLILIKAYNPQYGIQQSGFQLYLDFVMKYCKRPAYFILLALFLAVFTPACKSKEKQVALFELLDSKATGLEFTNHLTSTDSFNLFKYMYFYNGAGIGAGDFNNDGQTDLFFSSNQGKNTLYLNTGKLHFKDVTTQAKIPEDNAWSTGVSVVDINNDGLLDIYVCRIGKYKVLSSHNQLLVCQGIDKNGIPQYIDKANEYGLDFSGFSTQAVFLDYDMDGDLDMFLLNHSVHQNSNYRPRKDFIGTFNNESGGRMYRNDQTASAGSLRFTDVTHDAGINSFDISYGLGVVVADINMDGYPDIYVGNDFHENDYLYINQKNGTFKDEINDHIMHTSQYTMGVDAADVNNDGYPEIVSVDMLSADPYVLKRSLGGGDYEIFSRKISFGYNYQYSRNNLQLNRKNGMFSEVGLYSGVAATDWSWAPLWMDFDNDGLKDLFISNGIPKRMNDIDYINFISDNEIQQKLIDNKIHETDAALIDKFPQIKLPNKFFRNNGQMQFSDLDQQVGNSKSTYSNGAVYADFDNDGDLDIVVNNIDDAVVLYQNKNNEINHSTFVDFKLTGPANNKNAVGSKVVLFAKDGIRVYEKFPVHGFQSSMEIPVQIGLDKTTVDSMFVVWPDNTYEPIQLKQKLSQLTVAYKKGLPKFDYNKLNVVRNNAVYTVQDITDVVNLKYLHKEDEFEEFDREPLIPHMFSTDGPALAVSDINHDGLDDVFIGSSRDNQRGIFLQDAAGKFNKIDCPALDADSTYEDVDACWVDVNNDGHNDLVIASGGNEFIGISKYLLPRVYLNNGTGHFTPKPDAFEQVFVTASTVAPCDFNGDGFTDLFIGGRTVPMDYGRTPLSYLLQNDGTGKFKNVTAQQAQGLANVGFVTQASWHDLDKDGDLDLLLALEWDGITAFINDKGKLTKKVLNDRKGWWNFALPVDVDNDGDLDLVAGNLGLNSRLNASEKEPVRLYFNDFDGNGQGEQVLTYYVKGKEIPLADKAQLEKQMPVLKKRFLYAKNLAEASLQEIFTPEKLKKAHTLTADYFSNAILINDGKMNFTAQPLPWNAQFTSYKDALVVNANGDNLPDILMVGNYYENNMEMGRYDADYGTLLINKGQGKFSCEATDGLKIKGQARHLKKITIANNEAIVVARNNDSAMVIQFKKPAKM